MTLQHLIEQIGKATGADRELDAAIVDALGVVEMTAHDWIVGSEPINRLAGRTYMSPAPLTASVDAALALVEQVLPGRTCGFIPGFYVDLPFAGVIQEAGAKNVDLLKATIVGGNTPALAILSALLTARLNEANQS